MKTSRALNFPCSAILVLACCLLTFSASAAPIEKSTPLGTALNWIPGDAAFYVSFLRNREQVETVAASRAWARLRDLPICHESVRLLAHPAVRAAWQIGKTHLAAVTPAVEQTEMVLNNPQTQRFLELLAEIFSHEVFVCGDRGFAELADGAAVPSLLLGFKIRDRNLAAEHLGKLELILGLACMTKPEFQGRMARERIDDTSYLTFRLDKRLLSGIKEPLPPTVAPDKQTASTPGEKTTVPSLVFAVGIKDDYLLVSLGPSTDALKKLSTKDKIGYGRLIDCPEMQPLARQLRSRLTAIAYCSRELHESLSIQGRYAQVLCKNLDCLLNISPLAEETKACLRDGATQLGEDLKTLARRPGAIVAFGLMNDRGIETYCFDYGEHPWKDGYKPLALLDHVGGRPLLLVSLRAGFTVDQYDLFVKRLSGAYDDFEDRVLWKIDAKYRKSCRLAVALLRPLLRQLDRINREVLIPTLQDGQVVFVLNDDGPALVTDTAAAERLHKVYEEYWLVYRDVCDALADVRSGERPDFTAAVPGVYPSPLPAWMPLGFSNVGRSGRVVILAASPSAARRLLEPSPPELGIMPAKADHARATVLFVDCAAMVDRASPVVRNGVHRMTKLLPAGANPVTVEKQVVLHADALLECLKVLRSVARETYVENGAVVTHTFWELRDVD